MSRNRRYEKFADSNTGNRFEENSEADSNSLRAGTDAIFGRSAEGQINTGRVVARPVPLTDIWADVRQPRRAIPASIRLVWNGNPKDVPSLLNTWAEVAADAAGRAIDIQGIILAQGDGFDTDNTPSVYESFIDLLRLASTIMNDGLINPITIVDQRDRHLIESGERRWLAYWLLHLYTQAGDEFARIPATISTGADYVWRQAVENTKRRNLNAVSMARQLALLIMAARGQDQYADYDQIVTPGGSDRRYYAQVADGNVHRIPRGAGERIQAAMGLSMTQLSQYRRLLRLTDDEEINDLLWLRGDIEDWPELALRNVATLTLVKVREIISRDSWALDDFRAAVAPAPTLPPSGTRHGLSPAPSTGTRYEGAEQVESDRVLADLREGFRRLYELELVNNPAVPTAAARVTQYLNQAQGHYDHHRLVSARQALDDAFNILNTPLPPPPAQPTPQRHQLSEYDTERLLKWAWRWGMGHLDGGGWFTRQDIGNQVESGDLGTLILKNFLQQSATSKNGRDLVRYRITPVACRYLGAGFDVIDWDALENPPPNSSPRPEGEGLGVRVSPSDNPPSEGSTGRVIEDGHNIAILVHIRNLANATGKQGAADAANYLLNMTWEQAQRDAQAGTFEPALQMCYDSINTALGEWSQTLGELLNHVIEETTG